MREKYIPKLGILTDIIIKEYILYLNNKNLVLNNSVNYLEITSLYANDDINKPLYFWQLYNILGKEIIIKLITIFYTKIFNDTNFLWFKEEFEDLGNLQYHINGQTNFWLDIMGGGPYYNGGLKKLNNKHKLVKNIMTKKGADLWMYYMIESLKEIKNDISFDSRILICLVDFLYFFMMKYGYEFDFNFTDFRNSKL